MTILYCDSGRGWRIKVGRLFDKGERGSEKVFCKHRAHLMRVIGPRGGYGIQRHCFTDDNTKHDLQAIFRSNPSMKIVIKDTDSDEKWQSEGLDWLEHEHKGNYGDGQQMFLSIDYMRRIR